VPSPHARTCSISCCSCIITCPSISLSLFLRAQSDFHVHTNRTSACVQVEDRMRARSKGLIASHVCISCSGWMDGQAYRRTGIPACVHEIWCARERALSRPPSSISGEGMDCQYQQLLHGLPTLHAYTRVRACADTHHYHHLPACTLPALQLSHSSADMLSMMHAHAHAHARTHKHSPSCLSAHARDRFVCAPLAFIRWSAPSARMHARARTRAQ